MVTRAAVCVVVLAALVAALAPVPAQARLRAAWLDLMTGPATGADAQCCHSAACGSDNHCVEATCNDGDNSTAVCAGYSCYHCECCPCCGDGQHCVGMSAAPFTKGVCCPNGYTGATCDQPICTAPCAHGKCSAPGTCTCSKGWSGATCDVASCTPACKNGKCTGPDTCTCKAGWSGPDCGAPVCTEGCGHGNCTKPDQCTCDKDWYGTTCNSPLCPAGCVHGVCQSPSNCVCQPGWEGIACGTCVPDPSSWANAGVNQTFTVATAVLGGCVWKEGTNATVTLTGVTSALVTAGTVQYRLYESGAQHFMTSGFSPYFQCTNKGCDPTHPIALRLQDPTASATNYTLSFGYTMPAAAPNATNAFTLYVYGEDQRHQPYDFTINVFYNYTTAPPLGYAM